MFHFSVGTFVNGEFFWNSPCSVSVVFALSLTMNCKKPFNFKISNHPTALLLTFLLTIFPWFFVSQARFSPCCTFFQLGHQYIKLRNPSKSRCLQQHSTYHFFPSSEASSIWTVWSGCSWCLYCCYMEDFFWVLSLKAS